MSFLSNLNYGGGTVQTTSFGGSTSFDFGSIGNAAVSGGTKSGGFDSGDAANAALDAAASAIPFGSMAKKLLDDLGLSRNVDLVSKYGFSSWGASTSPEQSKQQMAQNILPFVQSRIESINAQNVQAILNEIETTLMIQKYYKEHQLKRHTNAKSTKLSRQWWIKNLDKLRKDTLNKLVVQLRATGATVTSKTVTRHISEIGIEDITDSDSGDVIDGDDVNTPNLIFKQYAVDFSTVKELVVDEKGNIKKKSSGFGLMALLGGVGYAVKSGAIKL